MRLAAVEEVERTARQATLGSELVVVTTPTNGMLLSPIVTSFIARRPQTALRLRRAGDMTEVLRMVAAGEAELGFGDIAHGSDNPSVDSEAIWQATVVIVSPVGTDLPEVVPWSALATSRLVLPLGGSERRKLIDDAITADGGDLPVGGARDRRTLGVDLFGPARCRLVLLLRSRSPPTFTASNAGRSILPSVLRSVSSTISDTLTAEGRGSSALPGSAPSRSDASASTPRRRRSEQSDRRVRRGCR